MPRLYFFADEAGDFDFRKAHNVSRYFILCTVSMETCDVAHALISLRRELAWEGAELGDYFHCTTDKQAVRDRVFETICQHDFRVQATIMEKSKAQPQIRKTRPRFYQHGWYYHFQHQANPIVNPIFDEPPELLVTAATIGTKKERASFLSSIENVMDQTVPGRWRTNFCPAGTDPCVQVADYCAWAIQRKWERGDTQSYDLIRDRVTAEYDLWAHGKTHHY